MPKVQSQGKEILETCSPQTKDEITEWMESVDSNWEEFEQKVDERRQVMPES